MMVHTPVISTLISSVGYDAEERTLELVLRFGTQRFYGVPVGVYRELISASSKGKYYHRSIAKYFATEPESVPPTLSKTDVGKIAEVLAKYAPPNAVSRLAELITTRGVKIVITRPRRTKLGDYSNPRRYGFHKITINGDLNPFRFLITMLHELAHLDTWNEYRNTVDSHGPEWRRSFRSIAHPFVEQGIFPEVLAEALQSYLRRPSYSSCVDHSLQRALKLYDEPTSTVPLEQLPYSSVFKLKDGMVLRKGRLLRKRYLCYTLDANVPYRVGAVVEVTPLEDPLDSKVNDPTGDCAALLEEACRWNKVELVKKLVERGGTVNSVLPSGKKAAFVALQNKHTDLAMFLLSLRNEA